MNSENMKLGRLGEKRAITFLKKHGRDWGFTNIVWLNDSRDQKIPTADIAAEHESIGPCYIDVKTRWSADVRWPLREGDANKKWRASYVLVVHLNNDDEIDHARLYWVDPTIRHFKAMLQKALDETHEFHRQPDGFWLTNVLPIEKWDAEEDADA